jgi:hypothetical protein
MYTFPAQHRPAAQKILVHAEILAKISRSVYDNQFKVPEKKR